MRIGIDFGTSFSLPAAMHFGHPQLLLPGGVYGIPSVFYYDSTEGVLIGQEAEDAGQGRQSVNMRREIKMDLFSSFTADGHTFTGKEIVGYILSKLVNIAMDTAEQKLIGNTLDGVVISVPAAFEHNEKALIMEAAKLPQAQGGPELNVLSFIKEPVAAAIAYFREAQLPDGTNILVYDLGGGTCDIAVVRSQSDSAEKYEVVASEMVRVGGRMWDDAIIDFLSAELEKQTGHSDLRSDPDYRDKIRRAAVDAKHKLSTNTSAAMRVEVDGKVIRTMITREQFDQLTAGLLRRTLEVTRKVAQNPAIGQIDYVVCVGGSSNMPQVKTAIVNMFPGVEVKLYEPEKAITFGAAIYAEWLGGGAAANADGGLLKDIAAYSYGIEFWYNYDNPDKRRTMVKNIIKKGEPLPAKGVNRSTPLEDGQSESYFEIFESENTGDTYDREEGRKVGDLILRHPGGALQTDKTQTTLTLNSSGLLEVEAVDLKHGNKESVEIKLDYRGE
jgi:molecular chaperone DnaK